MRYEVEIRPSAVRDLKRLAPVVAQRIISKLELLRDSLRGDVKRLTNHTYEYRLRVGDYRVLFTVEDDKIVVYRVRHRREAYGR